MNNPHVQEKYILTTSSSFTNLFELYTLWVKYRDEENTPKEIHPIVGKEYRFTKEYLKNKMYLVDNGVNKNLYQTNYEKRYFYKKRKSKQPQGHRRVYPS